MSGGDWRSAGRQAGVLATVIVVMTLGCDDGDDCNGSGDLYWRDEVQCVAWEESVGGDRGCSVVMVMVGRDGGRLACTCITGQRYLSFTLN